MSFTVEFTVSLANVEPDVIKRLKSQLADMCVALEEIPEINPLWDSMEASELRLDVTPWRFFLKVNRADEVLVVQRKLAVVD